MLLGALVVWTVIAHRSGEVAELWIGGILAVVIVGVAAWLGLRWAAAVEDRTQSLADMASTYKASVDNANERADGLATELVRAQQQLAELTAAGDPAQLRAVLSVLGQRQHVFITRAQNLLETLQNKYEDPDILNGLFELDHLVTLMLRKADNVRLLAGANAPVRQFRNAQPWYTVFSAAIAETQKYKRVQTVRQVDGWFAGHAAADIIHLLAELVENATEYSRDDTTVTVFVHPVKVGVTIEIVDMGVGIETDRMTHFNEILKGARPVDASADIAQGKKGSIGLWVVRRLVERLGADVHVWLTPNQYGGTTAHVVIPERLLGAPPDTAHQSPDARPASVDYVTTADSIASQPRPESSRPTLSADETVTHDSTVHPTAAAPADGAHVNTNATSRTDNVPHRARTDERDQPQWPDDPDVTGTLPTVAPARHEVASVEPPLLPRRQPGFHHLPPQLQRPTDGMPAGGFADAPPNPTLASTFLEARRNKPTADDTDA